jgi:hypothetical protein
VKIDKRSSSGLALELLVIVVGVLIALAVDQAVSGVQERALGRAYLSALKEDVEGDAERLRADFMPQLDQREAMAREVVSAITSGTQGDLRRLAVALDWAGHLRLFEPQRATFDDLLATGNLRLLEAREVRAQVIGYYDLTQLASMHELIRQEIWYGYRGKIDEVLDPLVMAELTRIEREVDQDLDRLVESLDAETVRRGLDLTTLRSSRPFREGIGASLEYTLVQRDQYRGRLSMAEDLVEVLDRVLSGS